MRKLYILVAIALIALPTFAAKKTILKKVHNGPDVIVYDLNTRNTVSTNDTLGTQNDVNIYGPFALVSAENDPMPTTVQVWGDVITGTTPTMAFDYQVISSYELADTIAAGWTSIDTLGATATNQACTIAGCGKAIVFRVNNYDATACQIPGMLRVGIKSAVTQYKTK